MKYNETVFSKLALPRLQRYYSSNKEYFLAQAMDYKDFIQEMSIAIWQELTKFEGLSDEEYGKLVNAVLSKRMIDAKRDGHKHMKSYRVTDEHGNNLESENAEEILGHSSQFVSLDEVDEKLLIDKNYFQTNRGLINLIKESLTEEEYNIIYKLYVEDYSEMELACELSKCEKDCISMFKTNRVHTRENTISQLDFQKECKQYLILSSKSKKINRLKKVILKKLKKILSKSRQ